MQLINNTKVKVTNLVSKQLNKLVVIGLFNIKMFSYLEINNHKTIFCFLKPCAKINLKQPMIKINVFQKKQTGKINKKLTQEQ